MSELTPRMFGVREPLSCLWTFLDILSLNYFFIAAGYSIKPGVLTVGYRLVSFWITGVLGFFALFFYRRHNDEVASS